MRIDVLLPTRPLRRLAPLAIGALLAAAQAYPRPALATSPAALKPTIQVLAAWIRWLPAGLPAAGYLSLTNIGDKPVALERASSPAYRDVTIHRSVHHGTGVQMTPVKHLVLEPHATLEFESSGYHLMLMQPTVSADAAAATATPITLYFSDGSSLTVPFQIRKSPAGD